MSSVPPTAEAIAPEHWLVTGGSGLLGGELKTLMPGAHFPTSAEFDIRDFDAIRAWAQGKTLGGVLHAAAFTSPPRINEDPVRAIETNIIGTANLTRLCIEFGWRLVYISTDYVYRGDAGPYKEDDPVLPVNKYAWSKLGGECSAMLHDQALIIRTTFGENVFPYPKAFTDQWTSRLSVAQVAPKIVAAAMSSLTGVLHVGGPRRTVYDYAKSLDPGKEIGGLSIHDLSFAVPADTSLDTSRYEREIG
ncbi:MAG: hypothetical protein RLZZ303_2550 [Candidatus Hydrogenedentota bacterium]